MGVGVLGRLVELGPGVGAGDINGRVLPRRSLGAAEPSDAEAVHLYHLAGIVSVNMANLGFGTMWFWRCGVAGDQAQALGSGLQAVPSQHPPDPVGRQLEAAPLRSSQFAGDPQRPAAGVGQGKSQDPLLQHRAGGVGHPRLAPLPWPQNLEPEALSLLAPAVVGRRVDPHRPAGCSYIAHLLGQPQAAQPEPEKRVILSQGGASHWFRRQAGCAAPLPFGEGQGVSISRG